jgi:hemolysin III
MKGCYGLNMSISRYLREPVNTVTHALGILLALGFGIAFLWRGNINLTLVIFASSMAVLYLCSSLYHGLKVSNRGILWLQKFDHSAIFVLIAGTYTPVLWTGLPDPWRWVALGAVWGVTVVGIALKFLTDLPEWLSLTLYILQGWLAVALLPVFLHSLPAVAFAALVVGGLLYTAGVPFYASRRQWRWRGFGAHEVWHLFVLAGSVAHGVMIWNLPLS